MRYIYKKRFYIAFWVLFSGVFCLPNQACAQAQSFLSPEISVNNIGLIQDINIYYIKSLREKLNQELLQGGSFSLAVSEFLKNVNYIDAQDMLVNKNGTRITELEYWEIKKTVDILLKDRDANNTAINNNNRFMHIVRHIERVFPVINGSNDCFYVKDLQFKRDFESIVDGAEIHVTAPGGGGDVLGAIVFILQLKEIFIQQGKPNITFKLICTNVKYGRENPNAGPCPVDYLRGLETIKGVSHFYRVKPGLRIESKLLDQKHHQINISGIPMVYEAEWSEGKIVDLLRERNIELLMMDSSQSVATLSREYQKIVSERKVYILGTDMGGDIFLQVPGAIKNKDHPEFFVSSPIADLIGMLVFNQGPVGVKALGGDGELGQTLSSAEYLPDYFKNKQIAAVLDDITFFQHHPKIIEEMKIFANLIASQVSGNYIRRHTQLYQQKKISLIYEYGPWNYQALLQENLAIKHADLRLEKRQEFIPFAYGATIFVGDVNSIIRKVKSPVVKQANMNWAQLSNFFQKQLKYVTEDAPYVTYRQRIKWISKLLTEYLKQDKISSQELIVMVYDKQVHITYRLAAIRALFMAQIDLPDRVKQDIGEQLVSMILNKKVDIFLVSEIAKTLGIMDYFERFDVLVEVLKNFSNIDKQKFFAGYYYFEYVEDRLRNTVERSCYSIIRKMLMQGKWEEAEDKYQEISKFVNHAEFKGLVEGINRAKDSVRQNNQVMKNESSSFNVDYLAAIRFSI
ncbi:MAG: hypothetical protein V1739_04735 [Candidatus Omnitrophota bacterium]